MAFELKSFKWFWKEYSLAKWRLEWYVQRSKFQRRVVSTCQCKRFPVRDWLGCLTFLLDCCSGLGAWSIHWDTEGDLIHPGKMLVCLLQPTREQPRYSIEWVWVRLFAPKRSILVGGLINGRNIWGRLLFDLQVECSGEAGNGGRVDGQGLWLGLI